MIWLDGRLIRGREGRHARLAVMASRMRRGASRMHGGWAEREREEGEWVSGWVNEWVGECQ